MINFPKTIIEIKDKMNSSRKNKYRVTPIAVIISKAVQVQKKRSFSLNSVNY